MGEGTEDIKYLRIFVKKLALLRISIHISYHRVLLCKKSWTLHKMNGWFETRGTGYGVLGTGQRVTGQL